MLDDETDEEDEEELEEEMEDEWDDREFVSDVSGDEDDGLSDLEEAAVSFELYQFFLLLTTYSTGRRLG